MFQLYFAGGYSSQLDDRFIELKACRLFSYANEKAAIMRYCDEDDRGPLLVDSGAFSVSRNKAVVDIDAYISFINNTPQVENFIELDLIPYPVLDIETAIESAEVSWENYVYMINRLDDPFKLLPVYHFGENLNYLKRMLEFEFNGQQIPFICIGGRHGVSTAKQEKYFRTVFKTIHESSNPNIKIHVLGMTVFSTLEKFPFYSADSTTYRQWAMYGNIPTACGIINVSDRSFSKECLSTRSDHELDIIIEEVNRRGFEIEELRMSYDARVRYAAEFCIEWAENYQYKGSDNFKRSVNVLF